LRGVDEGLNPADANIHAHLANPTRSGAGVSCRGLGRSGGVALHGLYLAFFASPADYQQGERRIMYIHVPSAWLSMMIYGLIASRFRSGSVTPPTFGKGRRADRSRLYVPGISPARSGASRCGYVLGLGCAADVGADPIFLYLGLMALRASLEMKPRRRLTAVLACRRHHFCPSSLGRVVEHAASAFDRLYLDRRSKHALAAAGDGQIGFTLMFFAALEGDAQRDLASARQSHARAPSLAATSHSADGSRRVRHGPRPARRFHLISYAVAA
jgi:hypothetical protein